MKNIKDPIHGEFITIRNEEIPILESQYVQRLRRVNQLGLSSLVYPSATHTRFSHSLGVMYLAGEIADSLGLSQEEKTAYRLGGLLHDVGHSPFSHATENLMINTIGKTHEERSCEIIDSLDEKSPVPSSKIKDIIMGDSEYNIVNGSIDVDRLDYLKRDAEQTGPKHGQIDVSAIIHFAELEDGIVFDEKALQEIENFFNSRFTMTKSVYAHHTSKISESMLEKAVEILLKNDDVEEEKVFKMDDYQLHSRLLSSETDAKYIYSKISNRELFKRCIYISGMTHDREKIEEYSQRISDKRDTEQKIARKAGVDQRDVVVDPPKIPSEVSPDVKISVNGSIKQFSELSPVVEKLNRAKWRNTVLGVYTPKEKVEEVKDAAKEVLNVNLSN